MICEEYRCEWWCVGATYFVGRCDNKMSPIPLRHHIEFNSLQINRSDKEYFNRLYIFGGTTNIPKEYRVDRNLQVGSNIQKRLCLPASKVPNGFIDIEANFNTGSYSFDKKEVVSSHIIYDEIFPSHISTIGNVFLEEGKLTNETTGEIESFPVFVVNDIDELGITPQDIEKGESLKLTFQEGSLLAGLTFEVKLRFNYQGNVVAYEIIRNNDYGTFFPNDIIKPVPGDKFVLSGFSVLSTQRKYFSNEEIFTVTHILEDFSSSNPTANLLYLASYPDAFKECIPAENQYIAIEFLDGSLKGKVFKVTIGYGPDKDFPASWGSVNVERSDTYGEWLPKKGQIRIQDTFKLYFYNKLASIDATLFGRYVDEAEERLLNQAKLDLSFIKNFGNIDSFTILMNPIYVNGYSPKEFSFLRMKDGIVLTKNGEKINMKYTGEVEWIPDHDRIDFKLGENISVYSETLKNIYFPTRILGFKVMLDGCGNDTYTCGINKKTTTLNSIEKRLTKLEYDR